MESIIRTIHSVAQSPERIVPQSKISGMLAKRLHVVGLTDAGPGYDMQRPRPNIGHVLICHGGAGEVWVQGHWMPCTTGQAYLSPPQAPMAFRTVGKRRWQFAWVFLPVIEGEPSPVPVPHSMLTPVDPRPIVNAIEGLYLEATGVAVTNRLEHWAELILLYLHEMVTGGVAPDPLWQLWAEVDNRLADPWTLERLANRVGMTPEALRRLSLRTTGRSPMRHVTHLRMRRAEVLLRSTHEKLFGIARQVGYGNVFAFSTAFHRWKGRSPKAFRGDKA